MIDEVASISTYLKYLRRNLVASHLLTHL